MDVFDIAINMEIEGQAFYEDIAKRTDNTGFRNILHRLAEEESKHRIIFEEMKKNSAQLQDNKIKTIAGSVFKGLKTEDFTNEKKQLGLYIKAQEIEKKSIDFYSEQEKKFDDETIRNMFARIIAEEKRHFTILDNIIEHVNRPESWVEHSEFTNREDY